MKIVNFERKTRKIKEYANSLGGSSSKIGSLGVCTINMPALAYKHVGDEEGFFKELKELVNDSAKANHARRKIVEKRIQNGNLPLYSYGFIDIKKQYSTCGINGLYECLDIMGFDIKSKEGQRFAIKIMNIINNENDKNEKQYQYPHNCEQIPGESASVKLCLKDKILKRQDEEHSYDFYSNQFIPLVNDADMLDRIYLQGVFDKYFSGGSILHINIENRIDDKEKIKELIRECSDKGVIYFALNYNLQMCENGHMSVGMNDTCSCGAKITDSYTRIVGYLTNTKSFNKTRREVDYPERKFYKSI